MVGFSSFDIYHIKLAWDASMKLWVSTACLGNEAQQIDGKEWGFCTQKKGTSSEAFPGLLQLAIIVELGIFASVYALACLSEKYYFLYWK
jgi:hypothetical protein